MTIREAKFYINCPVRVCIPRHYIDGVFYLTGCILRRKPNGEYFFQAEIADQSNHSTMVTGLDTLYPIGKGDVNEIAPTDYGTAGL